MLADARSRLAAQPLPSHFPLRSAQSYSPEQVDLEIRDILQQGISFISMKVSELSIADNVAAAFDFDVKTLTDNNVFLATPRAQDMLAVREPSGKPVRRPVAPWVRRHIARRLDIHGAVIVPGALPAQDCRRVAESTRRDILWPSTHFGTIMERALRKDLPLDLEGPQLQLLRSALEIVGPALSDVVRMDAELVEFSTLTTFAGASIQNKHGDTAMDNPEQFRTWRRLVSCFIYLDDIDADMAALDVWPGTHTHVQFLHREQRNLLVSDPSIRAAVPVGTMVLYDSRSFHRGSANTSPDRVRPTLYFSFLEAPHGERVQAPEGATYSLHPRLKPHKPKLSDILNVPLDGSMHQFVSPSIAPEDNVRWPNRTAIEKACQNGPRAIRVPQDGDARSVLVLRDKTGAHAARPSRCYCRAHWQVCCPKRSWRGLLGRGLCGAFVRSGLV